MSVQKTTVSVKDGFYTNTQSLSVTTVMAVLLLTFPVVFEEWQKVCGEV